MTREEALNILHNSSVYHPMYLDALNMAIEALEQEPCEDEYIKVPKNALKYRTAGMVAYNAEWLKNHFNTERAVICEVQEPCDDCISRQAAIEETWKEPSYTDPLNVLAELRDRIKDLPSAQPERKRGKWIPVTNGRGGHECNLCHTYAPSFQSGDEWLTDYCPNCGARMLPLGGEKI